MSENSPSPSLEPDFSTGGNESSAPRLYVEVEDGERVVLPPGMTEVDLLKSMLRRLLRDRPRLLPDPRDAG